MNPTKILIAALTIFLLGSLLSGCGLGTREPSETLQVMRYLEQVEKDVSLSLQAQREGDEVIVKVNLDNANRHPITSVQTWLSYNPDQLEGVRVNAVNSSFPLAAPYKSDFDPVNGLVMIGRSNPNPVSDASIFVAEIVFKPKAEGSLMLDAYDYKNTIEGHMSANVLLDGIPFNILKKPESPALIIKN